MSTTNGWTEYEAITHIDYGTKELMVIFKAPVNASANEIWERAKTAMKYAYNINDVTCWQKLKGGCIK